MKRIKPRRRVGNITNGKGIEIIATVTLRVMNHWANWKNYKGRVCRDKQIWKACDVVLKWVNKRYVKKM